MALYDGLRVSPTVDFAAGLLHNRGADEIAALLTECNIGSGRELIQRLRGPPPGDDDEEGGGSGGEGGGGEGEREDGLLPSVAGVSADKLELVRAHLGAEWRGASLKKIQEVAGIGRVVARKIKDVCSAGGGKGGKGKGKEKKKRKKKGEGGEGGEGAKPKRELSAYNVFMKQELAALKAEHPELDHQAAFKQVAESWKASPMNPKQAQGEGAQGEGAQGEAQGEEQGERLASPTPPQSSGSVPKSTKRAAAVVADGGDSGGGGGVKKRPRGRSPLGKVWNNATGEWDDAEEARAEVEAEGSPIAPSAAVAPDGAPESVVAAPEPATAPAAADGDCPMDESPDSGGEPAPPPPAAAAPASPPPPLPAAPAEAEA